ncbi:hypothetical protein BG57_01495 [Caballeronia grimmiae]|uniref:Uncharacterized protein n=1 Tax=Caballeronia grimmiae TaxID=1071679 RepID=A0A069PCB9_9BURK|nr:hypothetical protein BG57_01495 [Caballeronia grimmiae]
MRAWPLQGRRARTGGGQARQRIAFLGAATRRPILLAQADENEGKQSVGARQATSRIRPASRARPSPQP